MSTNSGSPVSLHERCQYPNKQCPKRRTTKNNGQLHRFCEEHKEKAKRNQERWLKTRLEKAQAKHGSTSTPAPPNAAATSISVPEVSRALPTPPLDNASLDDFEWLLFDEDELNELYDELILSHELMLDIQADVAWACRVINQ